MLQFPERKETFRVNYVQLVFYSRSNISGQLTPEYMASKLFFRDFDASISFLRDVTTRRVHKMAAVSKTAYNLVEEEERSDKYFVIEIAAGYTTRYSFHSVG